MYNCVFTSGTNQLVIARAISTTNYIQIWANTSGTVDIRGSITWYITPWND
jgi:hypothetical protein